MNSESSLDVRVRDATSGVGGNCGQQLRGPSVRVEQRKEAQGASQKARRDRASAKLT